MIKPINLIKDYKDRGGIIAFLDLTQRLIILRYDSKLFKDYIWYLISNKFYPPDIYHRKKYKYRNKDSHNFVHHSFINRFPKLPSLLNDVIYQTIFLFQKNWCKPVFWCVMYWIANWFFESQFEELKQVSPFITLVVKLFETFPKYQS